MRVDKPWVTEGLPAGQAATFSGIGRPKLADQVVIAPGDGRSQGLRQGLRQYLRLNAERWIY
jgi:hypothetical protein